MVEDNKYIEIEGVKYYSLLQASQLLHVTIQTVRTYVKTGKIKAVRIGRMIYIRENAIKDFIKEICI
jgi:excisionase family DNA binding protein